MAREWWEARTAEEKRRDYRGYSDTRGNRRPLHTTVSWTALDGREADNIARDLFNEGVILLAIDCAVHADGDGKPFPAGACCEAWKKRQAHDVTCGNFDADTLQVHEAEAA